MPNELREIGLKITNYKCFRDKPHGFDQILPFTIIIGRNNTGKSALLDLLAYIVTRQQTQMLTLDGQHATVIVEAPITSEDLERVIGPPWGDPSRIIGRRISWRLEPDGKQPLYSLSDGLVQPHLRLSAWQPVAQNKPNPFRGKRFARLAAERDMIPETAAAPSINTNGAGATRTIHHFRTSVQRDSALVEEIMLRDLNAIFAPDAHFTRIDTRERDGQWEVYLDEDRKGRVPLSRSGSGIKTVILVLAYLHLLPVLQGGSPSDYLYGFEELENNLHPAVQRRLLRYLHETSERTGCHFFLTTHSPTEIDYFARDEHAQVIHVTHDATTASTTTISGYLHGKGILDDLDIRASDILQSNGVIWVEGPSDRLYLNRWIELVTDGALREGAQYQILQYGGSLLYHLNAEDPTHPTETVHILTLNRNAAVLIDSDKIDEATPLRRTAARITGELQTTAGFSWVTAGRTVENYLPASLLSTALGSAPEQYDNVIEHIRANNNVAAERLPADKVALARAITPRLTREHLDVLDLTTRVTELCERIKAWNKLG